MEFILNEKTKNPNVNILIVGHGFTLRGIQNQLKIKGFMGRTTLNIKNGQLCLFED